MAFHRIRAEKPETRGCKSGPACGGGWRSPSSSSISSPSATTIATSLGDIEVCDYRG